MPPSKINGLKTGTFYEEFSEYLDILDTNGFAYKRFVDILETFDGYNILTSQHITMVIYLNHKEGQLWCVKFVCI